ncbi:MAG: hypothetical protein ABSE68_02165 [Minisyncoccia bacterium]
MNIKEIQNKSNDSNVNVSSLLRDAKIIASRLEQKDFLSWINKELNGYSVDDKVPDYRVVKGVPQGLNPYRGWIPYIHSDPKSHEIISRRGVGQSIAELEELLKDKRSSFEIKFPPDIADILRKGVKMDVDLRLVIDRAEVVGILEHVRNAILDWSIKLQREGISDEVTDFTNKEVTEAENVKSSYQIQNIENFQGNTGGFNKFELGSGSIEPQETFRSKFFWYGIVALIVLVLGNIVSALVLKYIFNI